LTQEVFLRRIDIFCRLRYNPKRGDTMKKLTDLPNIGKVVAKQLYAVGIKNDEDLIQTGSKKAWLLIQQSDPSACYNRLCGLEGAIQGIRRHHLSDETKADLKTFYTANTKW